MFFTRSDDVKQYKLVLYILVGVMIAFYLGGMVDFLPFYANELVVSEIGYCTAIICVVIALCTCIILDSKK